MKTFKENWPLWILITFLALCVASGLGAQPAFLGVKFYSQVSNPENIPGNWPAHVVELTNGVPLSGYTLMTPADYYAWRTNHQSEYDAWATNATNPRRKIELTTQINAEAEKRIQAMFGADPEKARTRQQQLQARFSELTLLALEAGGVTNLTAPEQAEIAALRAVWSGVKQIRLVEYSKTNAVAGGTNVAAVDGWPTP